MKVAKANTDEIWEWAWTMFQRAARDIPDCEHNLAWKHYMAEARKMQVYGLRQQDKIIAGRQPEPMPQSKKVKVGAVAEMDDELFVKHFNARHADSLSGMNALPFPIEFNIWQLYVAFHYRLHLTRPDLKHYHEEDALEDRIDRTIECLIERAWRGWFEIAGIEGLIAVFPGEDIATRINGVVEHHKDIEEATDRLLAPVTPVKAAAPKAKARK
jgi:hypothetical protein